MHLIEIFKNKLREVALLLYQISSGNKNYSSWLLDHYSRENCWCNDQGFIKRRVYTKDRNLFIKKYKTGS